MAFINNLIKRKISNYFENHFGLPVNNLELCHDTFIDYAWGWRVNLQAGATFRSISIKNNYFVNMRVDIQNNFMNEAQLLAASVIGNNHYVMTPESNPGVIVNSGTNVTVGGTLAAIYADPLNFNYRPLVGSILSGWVMRR